MNFKKFISGISAFAVAAGAFAGLTVTAGATGELSSSYATSTKTLSLSVASDTTASGTATYSVENAVMDFSAVALSGAELSASNNSITFTTTPTFLTNGNVFESGNYVVVKPKFNGILYWANTKSAVQAGSGTTYTQYYMTSMPTATDETAADYFTAGTKHLEYDKNAGEKSDNLSITMEAGKTYYLYNSCWYANKYKWTLKDVTYVTNNTVYNVSFTVQDANGAIEGASVSVGSSAAVTDSNGNAVVSVEAGTYDISVSRAGYDVYTQTSVDVNSDLLLETITLSQSTDTNYYSVSFNAVNNNNIAVYPSVKVSKDGAEIPNWEENGLQNGIYSYTAELNGYDSVTGAFTVNGDNVTVPLTMTESLYDTVIRTVPHAKITISGTSDGGTDAEDTVIYSDYAGSASKTLPTGTYSVSIEKGGYTTSLNNELVVTTQGGSLTETLSFSNSDMLLYEDFDTTGVNVGGFGIYGSGDNGMRLYSNGIAQIYNKNQTTVTIPVTGSTAKNGRLITMSSLYTHVGTNYSTGAKQINFGFRNGETAAVTFTLYCPGNNDTENVSKFSVVSDLETTPVIIDMDKTADMKITIGGGLAKIVYDNTEIANLRTSVSDVDSFFQKNGNSNVTSVTCSAISIEGVDISTPATADITFKQDYTSATDTDTEASLWEMTVTAGTDAVNSVDVTVDGKGSTGACSTVIQSGGSAVFGIVINKLQSAITKITAVINGTALN